MPRATAKGHRQELLPRLAREPNTLSQSIDSYAKKSRMRVVESVISVLAPLDCAHKANCGHARGLSSATIDRSLCRSVDVD